jgi:hypothetical protein
MAVFIIVIAPGDVVTGVRAKLGQGTPGTFTARRLECHKSCVWNGDFVSADGRKRRSGIFLSGAHRGDLKKGEVTGAVDTGWDRGVYPPGGNYEWIGAIVVLAMAVAGAVISALSWRSWFRSRREIR